VYLGHLLANHQTSWVGSIVVIFSICVTIGVAVYLYREFRSVKAHHERLSTGPPDLEQGETEFEIAPAVTQNGFSRKGNDAERTALVSKTSDEDDFFFNEEDEL
jgi:hypothetical protein